MAKILGLDLGTNSTGWAITEEQDSGHTLLEKGVDIFKDGVEHEKSIEIPSVQQRTEARALRRHYFRRRLRKIQVLKVLLKYDFCPTLSPEQLDDWKCKKIYPLTDEFIAWQRTDDNQNKNPYYYRHLALTERLDMNKQTDRYQLGRAFYHLAQRRGFLSNRKDSTKESEGNVKQGISELTAKMQTQGCDYLGEYFYRLYQQKGKIRNHYTAREIHYKAEFNAICNRQDLPGGMKDALERAIFFQRPLKSQKGQVGKCQFEKSKSRCPISHPRFEEFRMLAFINNKKRFDFEDIAKNIAGKKKDYYGYMDDRATFRINLISECPHLYPVVQ